MYQTEDKPPDRHDSSGGTWVGGGWWELLNPLKWDPMKKKAQNYEGLEIQREHRFRGRKKREKRPRKNNSIHTERSKKHDREPSGESSGNVFGQSSLERGPRNCGKKRDPMPVTRENDSHLEGEDRRCTKKSEPLGGTQRNKNIAPQAFREQKSECWGNNKR